VDNVKLALSCYHGHVVILPNKFIAFFYQETTIDEEKRQKENNRTGTRGKGIYLIFK